MKNHRKEMNHSTNGFLSFIFKESRTELIAIVIFALLEYLLFAYFYPWPVSTIDTPNYVWCAITGEIGAYRPFGYSAFIKLTGLISHSWSAFTYIQFLFHLCSLILFIYTVKYFFRPTLKGSFLILAILCVGSESLVYLCFWLMSDSLFISITLLWLTSLIWLVNYKKSFLVIVTLVLAFILMKLRYTGMVFPFVTIISVFMLNRGATWYIALLSLFTLFIVYLQGVSGNKRFVGVDTFSGFTGWAKANNATCVLPYVDIDTTKFSDETVLRIHQICKAYPDSFFKMDYVRKTAFMWYKEFPGKVILMEYYYNNQQQIPYVKCWSIMGTKMNKYANEIIREHPFEFARRFVIWNLGELLFPMNNFDKYPTTAPDQFTKEWFKISEPTMHAKNDIFFKYFSKYTYLKYVVSFILGMIAIIIFYFRREVLLSASQQKNTVIVISVFIILTAIFLVISHPIHLRYVVMFTTLFFSLFYMLINNYLTDKQKQDGKN